MGLLKLQFFPFLTDFLALPVYEIPSLKNEKKLTLYIQRLILIRKTLLYGSSVLVNGRLKYLRDYGLKLKCAPLIEKRSGPCHGTIFTSANCIHGLNRNNYAGRINQPRCSSCSGCSSDSFFF